MNDGSDRQQETLPRPTRIRPTRIRHCVAARAALRSLGVALVLTGALSHVPSRAEADFRGPPQGAVTKSGAAEPTTSAVQDPVDDPAEAPSNEQRRENLAQVLLMLLTGVVLLGASMIAATMIWGAKLRRTARLPESGPTRQDELWYLKTPPPSSDGPEPGVQDSDDPSSPPTTNGETAT